MAFLIDCMTPLPFSKIAPKGGGGSYSPNTPDGKYLYHTRCFWPKKSVYVYTRRVCMVKLAQEPTSLISKGVAFSFF